MPAMLTPDTICIDSPQLSSVPADSSLSEPPLMSPDPVNNTLNLPHEDPLFETLWELNFDASSSILLHYPPNKYLKLVLRSLIIKKSIAG